jgi:TonB family protein
VATEQGDEELNRRISWTQVLVLVLLLGFALQAQEPTALSTASAMSRVTNKVAPVYPVAAKQLNIQGSMDVAVVVSESGEVEDAKVVKGNAMFSQACLTAVKQWKFTPLEKGKFSTVITFNFTKS